jgi:serine/threonine protein phosphatase PrpC
MSFPRTIKITLAENMTERMRTLSGHAQHIGARHSQQDSFGLADPEDHEFIAHGGFVAVICDGMGGMEHGEAAGRTAVEAFLDAYKRKIPEESIPDALLRSVREANEEVVTLAATLNVVENMGTTLVAVALTRGGFYHISVGDSAIFRVTAGEVAMVNRHHVFSNFLDEAVNRGVMSREDADRHPERESLTSYVGVRNLEEIDRNVEAWELAEGESVLLASDGMFKSLEGDELLAGLHGPPQTWPETLVAKTLAKGFEFQDNVTVLSVTIAGPDTEEVPPKKDDTVELRPTLPLPAPHSRRMLSMMILIVVLMLTAATAAAVWNMHSKHK